MESRLAKLTPDFLKPVLRPIYRGYLRLNQITATLLDKAPSLPLLEHIVSPNFRARIARLARRKEMDSRESLYRFWKQERPDGNYFSAPPSSPRSQTILTMLGDRISPQDSILEVGCNVGRNLNHLMQTGFTRLSGLEISEAAVKRLRQHYPGLSDIAVDIGAAEDVLRGYPDDFVDLVFTMAVLEHVHPESRSVFADMARVARKYVLTIEPVKGHRSHRQYPWDIVREFESAGLKVLDKRIWSSLWTVERKRENSWHPGFDGYEAILFAVPSRSITPDSEQPL